MKQTIGFFYLKTGGGHISGAKAISDKIIKLYGEETNCILHNGLENIFPFFPFFFEEGYSLTSNYFVSLYLWFYRVTSSFIFLRIWKRFFSIFITRKLIRFLRENDITKAVCLHEILIPFIRDAINTVNPDIKLITIVMDPFTAHPTWFFEKNTELIVFSEKLRKEAIQKYGFKPEQIHKFPIFLSDRFNKPYGEEQKMLVRKRLGILEEKKIVLIAGGGEGLKAAGKIVFRFIKRDFREHIIVVCGKNRKLRIYLENLVKYYKFKNIHIFGFVSFMPDLMNIAECIIAKSGPATIMEALSIGKPLILSSFVRGQELGNMLFVNINKCGWYLPKSKDVVLQTEKILNDRELQNKLKERISNLKIKNGVDDIARFIVDF